MRKLFSQGPCSSGFRRHSEYQVFSVRCFIPLDYLLRGIIIEPLSAEQERPRVAPSASSVSADHALQH